MYEVKVTKRGVIINYNGRTNRTPVNIRLNDKAQLESFLNYLNFRSIKENEYIITELNECASDIKQKIPKMSKLIHSKQSLKMGGIIQNSKKN